MNIFSLDLKLTQKKNKKANFPNKNMPEENIPEEKVPENNVHRHNIITYQMVDEWLERLSYSLRNNLDFNEPDPRGIPPRINHCHYSYYLQRWI